MNYKWFIQGFVPWMNRNINYLIYIIMKKIFTLLCGLFCLAGAVKAASTIDDVQVCKHSYVLIGDAYTNDGTVQPQNYSLIGDGYFLLVGTDGMHSVSTGKGSVDLSAVDGEIVTEEIAAKYGEYGSHRNSLRLKNNQDGVAMKVTAGSKLIIFYENNKAAARRPLFCTEANKDKMLADQGTMVTAELNSKGIGRIEWTAPDDMDLYIMGENQLYISYLIVEANEAPGTPSVKVGPQTYDNGLWFREVTCKAVKVDVEGEQIGTVVTYTTDGSAPTAASPVYTEPIKCYQDMVVKFQAYYDLGGGTASEEMICTNADNEAPVSFSFDAPALEANGATFTITSPYEGAKNYYQIAGADAVEGNGTTLTESATVTAYSQIVNGTYATFTTKSVIADVYVLNDVKEEKNITVSGTAVEDAEATATSTTGTVYKIENGAITADKMDFFVKNLEFGALANADAAKAKYQVPAGQEAYIKMNATTISFNVAEGDSVEITVVCSKNSCKNIDETDEDVKAEGSKVADNRKCFINVDGTNYGGVDLVDDPTGNVVTFRVGAGIHTFQKYSGTGNILISSIKFVPMIGAGVENLAVAEQKVAAKKVFRNGRLVIETANGTFNVAGVRVK
jgi:hypothetical protein